MSRGQQPMIYCDGDDGWCGATEVDYYEVTASIVDSTQITRDKPAPGWRVVDGNDLCPKHSGADQ